MSAPAWVVIQYLFRIGQIKDLSHPYRIVQRLDSNTIWPTNELSLSWCMLASISLDSLCNLSAFVCRPWLVFSPYTHSFLMFFAQIPLGVPSRNPVLPGERIDFAKSKIGIIWCYQCLHTNAISNMCTVNLLVIHNFTFKTYLLPPKINMKPRKTALWIRKILWTKPSFLIIFGFQPFIFRDVGKKNTARETWAKSDGCAVTGVSCANSLNERKGVKNGPKMQQRIHYAFSDIQFLQVIFCMFLLIPSEWYIWSMTCNLPGSILSSTDHLSSMIIMFTFNPLNHGSTGSSKLLTHCQGGMCCATGTTGITTPRVVRHRACWSWLAWYFFTTSLVGNLAVRWWKGTCFCRSLHGNDMIIYTQQLSCFSQQCLLNPATDCDSKTRGHWWVWL